MDINKKYPCVQVPRGLDHTTSIPYKAKRILDLLEELIKEHTEQTNLKKIESLEQKLINNLDESSYSELVKLKSQLNRE